jgi:putative endonuclease
VSFILHTTHQPLLALEFPLVPYVYLLRCRDGTLYAGAAKDLARRLAAHAAGRASRYTRARLPVALVWWQEMETWSAALREEVRLKRLDRSAKSALVSRAELPDLPPVS